MTLINESNFESETNKKGIVVVDFFAEGCGPCKMLSPIMEQLSNQYTDIGGCKVNVDEAESLAAKFGVSSIPTVIFFKDGQEVSRSTGYRPAADFEQIIAQLKNA